MGPGPDRLRNPNANSITAPAWRLASLGSCASVLSFRLGRHSFQSRSQISPYPLPSCQSLPFLRSYKLPPPWPSLPHPASPVSRLLSHRPLLPLHSNTPTMVGSPVHPASLVDPSLHSPALMELVEIEMSRTLIGEYTIPYPLPNRKLIFNSSSRTPRRHGC